MSQRQTAPARPLWDRIERIRLEKGWTKVQLARATGIDRTTLNKWRHQPRSPQPPTVKQLADRLGIDPDEALRLAGITGPTLRAAEDAAEEGEDRLERAWRRYRDDPGPRGAVLRELVGSWDRDDGEDDAQDGRSVG